MLVTGGKLYNDDFQGLFSPHIIRVMKQRMRWADADTSV